MELLKQMLPPAALGAAVGGAIFFVLTRCRWKSAGRCPGAIAIGAGYIAGHALAAGLAPFPPRSATPWLFWFAVIGIIAAAADSLVRLKGTIRLVVWATICTVACRFILQPKFSYAWSSAEGPFWVVAFAVGLVGLTCVLDLMERRAFGPATLFSVTTVLGTGTCIALMLSGSLLLGQLACVLTAIAATCFLLIIAVTTPVPPTGAAAPLSLVCSGLWLSGFFYAELPPASAVLLAVAPALGSLPVGRKSHSRWLELACRAGLVALPVVVAVVLAFQASPPLED
jgi:hypothetical protein